MRMTTIARRTALTASSLALAAALAACGGGSGDGGDSSSPAQETTQSDSAGTEESAGGSGASDDGGASTGASDNGGDSSSKTDDSRTVLTSQPSKNDLDLRKQQFKVTAADAIKTATDEVGAGGTVHAVELDHSSTRSAYEWDVKILKDGKDHKVAVDAITGKVAKNKAESTTDKEEAIDLQSPMTLDEAMTLATDKVDGPVREWKLEYDDGHKAYEFDIDTGNGHETEVKVDVDTKAVTVD